MRFQRVDALHSFLIMAQNSGVTETETIVEAYVILHGISAQRKSYVSNVECLEQLYLAHP